MINGQGDGVRPRIPRVREHVGDVCERFFLVISESFFRFARTKAGCSATRRFEREIWEIQIGD
jgi:hypothetical protein